MVVAFDGTDKAGKPQKGSFDFGPAQAHDLTIQQYIFATVELRIESGPQFQQCRDPPAGHNASFGGLQNAANDLEKRALAAPVRPHQAQRFPFFHVEGDVTQSPEISVERLGRKRQKLADAIGGTLIKAVEFGKILNEDQLRWWDQVGRLVKRHSSHTRAAG